MRRILTQPSRLPSRSFRTSAQRLVRDRSRIQRGPVASSGRQLQHRGSKQQGDEPINIRSNQENQESHRQEPLQPPSSFELVKTTLAENESSDLVAPVRIPDDPDGVLQPDHPAMAILNHSSIVVQRQIEMMNVFLGFEQANRYVLMDGRGETIGYLAEQDHGFGQAMARQMLRTHRSFTAHIFDRNEREVLRIHRPFAWINSRIRMYDPITSNDIETHEPSASTALEAAPEKSSPSISLLALADMRIIGEAQQQWAFLRRKYNIFSYRPLDADVPSVDAPKTEAGASDAVVESAMTQFATIDAPPFSLEFTLLNQDKNIIGSVGRSFGGFAREFFTDTGVYALRMDSAALMEGATEHPGGESALTLDQRAVMLATAVSIDFDYFSRHSSVGGGGFLPLWFPGMGGGAEAGAGAGAAGAGAGEVAAGEGAAGALGSAAGRGAGAAGMGEGAIAGAGTMAGYEAMQRGRQGYGQGDDASPTANDPYGAPPQSQPGQGQAPEETWGEWKDPWDDQGRGGGGASGGGGGGDGGGDGGGFDIGDWL
ncbi:hypothetical protein MBLNU457_g1034t1 [Dothideomycetes sp. NU457]